MYITLSLAIPPPITILVTNNSTPNTFEMASTNGTATYLVELGAEFEVHCSSLASENNTYVGMVTWYMTNISSGWYILSTTLPPECLFVAFRFDHAQKLAVLWFIM